MHECDKSDLEWWEQFFIDDYRETNSVNRLYNIREVAKSNLGFKHSEETKHNIKLLMMIDIDVSDNNARYFQITFTNGDVVVIKNLREYAALNQLTENILYKMIKRNRNTPYKNIVSICRV